MDRTACDVREARHKRWTRIGLPAFTNMCEGRKEKTAYYSMADVLHDIT